MAGRTEERQQPLLHQEQQHEAARGLISLLRVSRPGESGFNYLCCRRLVKLFKIGFKSPCSRNSWSFYFVLALNIVIGVGIGILPLMTGTFVRILFTPMLAEDKQHALIRLILLGFLLTIAVTVLMVLSQYIGEVVVQFRSIRHVTFFS